MGTIGDLGEFGLIERIAAKGLAREAGVVCGIGDDCAVLSVDPRKVLLLTSDLMVEDVHFRLDATSHEHAKAAHRRSRQDQSLVEGTKLDATACLVRHDETVEPGKRLDVANT